MKHILKAFAAIAAVLVGALIVYDWNAQSSMNREIGQAVLGVLLVAAGLTPVFLWRRSDPKMLSTALGATAKLIEEQKRLEAKMDALRDIVTTSAAISLDFRDDIEDLKARLTSVKKVL